MWINARSACTPEVGCTYRESPPTPRITRPVELFSHAVRGLHPDSLSALSPLALNSRRCFLPLLLAAALATRRCSHLSHSPLASHLDSFALNRLFHVNHAFRAKSGRMGINVQGKGARLRIPHTSPTHLPRAPPRLTHRGVKICCHEGGSATELDLSRGTSPNRGPGQGGIWQGGNLARKD